VLGNRRLLSWQDVSFAAIGAFGARLDNKSPFAVFIRVPRGTNRNFPPRYFLKVRM
jgi:hypothetical protein